MEREPRLLFDTPNCPLIQTILTRYTTALYGHFKTGY